MDRPLDVAHPRLDVNCLPAPDEGHDQPREPRREAAPAKDGENPLGAQALESLALVEEEDRPAAALEHLIEGLRGS
eukprot:14951545-Alexandrium_andersonii.AAC.1